MINKLLQIFNKNKKIYTVLLVVFVVVFIFYIQSLISSPGKKTTTPIIPTNISSLQDSYSTELFPKKYIVYNWNNVQINIPISSKKYFISKSLVNKDTTNNLFLSFGFVSDDFVKTRKESSKTWSNKTATLFSSLDQNQIIYYKKDATPAKTSNISETEAVAISKEILSKNFGENFISTLDSKPSVRFLIKETNKFTPTPVSNPQDAEYIEIGFKQTIDNYPLSSISGNTNIVTVVIDNQKNLNRLEIHGGYLELASQGEQNLLDVNVFKAMASEKALKISSLSDVLQESGYLDSSNINVDVSDTFFGYFIASDNSIVPVVFISGTMQSDQLIPQTTTFVVPVGLL